MKEPASHLGQLAVRFFLQPTRVNHIGGRQLFEPPPEGETVKVVLECVDELLHLLDGHRDRFDHHIHRVLDCLGVEYGPGCIQAAILRLGDSTGDMNASLGGAGAW